MAPSYLAEELGQWDPDERTRAIRALLFVISMLTHIIYDFICFILFCFLSFSCTFLHAFKCALNHVYEKNEITWLWLNCVLYAPTLLYKKPSCDGYTRWVPLLEPHKIFMLQMPSYAFLSLILRIWEEKITWPWLTCVLYAHKLLYKKPSCYGYSCFFIAVSDNRLIIRVQKQTLLPNGIPCHFRKKPAVVKCKMHKVRRSELF